MIMNDHQYCVTREKADKLRQTIDWLKSNPPKHPDVHPRMVHVDREAIEKVVAGLQAEMDAYDALKSGP